MALRLQDCVIDGYFGHPHRNLTMLRLALHGLDTVLMADLVGAPGPQFQGRCFEFRARVPPDESAPTSLPKGLMPMQVGAAGTMELRMVKVPRTDDTSEEALLRHGFDWKPCLYLEWYSQNGRVVIELVDPIIEPTDDLPAPEAPAPPGSEEEPTMFSVSTVSVDDEGEAEIQTVTIRERDADESLDDYLERLDRQRENAWRGESDVANFMAELEYADHLITNESGEFIASMLEPQRLPAVYDVDEERAEELVLSLAAQLALVGVGIHLCKHCTMLDAYRFLLEVVLQEGRTHPELKGMGWTMNYSYGETCAECGAEIDAEYEGFASDGEVPE